MASIGPNKQCFTPIQTVTVPSSKCLLCPSMDIMALISKNRLLLQRTVSWQRLATYDQDGIQALGWSPDGSMLALSIPNEGFVLYELERGMSNSGDAEESLVHKQKLQLPESDEFQIQSLTWAQVGKPHASWVFSAEEKEREREWRYRRDYLDRSTLFLPPSSYNQERERGSKNSHPAGKTPLSLLCASTNTGDLQLLIHGRYPIATLYNDKTLEKSTIESTIVCSSDLSHISALKQQNGEILSFVIYSVPAFVVHRYSLQIISSHYSSVQSHLQAIEEGIPAVISAWKNALRPLDMKMNALSKILENYGITNINLGTVLKNHMILGSAWEHANALEQFWTGVQMNDQLMVKMQKALHNNVAGVETMAKSNLLAPARALMIRVQELYGLDEQLLPETLRLAKSANRLFFAIEYLVSQIFLSRLRLRDFVSWLRSSSSAVKAQGTPSDSVQSQNARKRRVPQALIHRVASYFRDEKDFELEEGTPTERIIGSCVSIILSGSKEFVRPKNDGCTSPNSIKTSLFDPKGISTLPPALNHTMEVAYETFDQPRVCIRKTISRQEIILPENKKICAINSRMGVETSPEADESTLEGAFQPLTTSTEISFSASRHWTIVAVSMQLSNMQQGINLFLLPLGAKPESFVLSRCLSIPSDYVVQEIGFYGDDGKSSLNAGKNDDNGKEGRQALGLLLKSGKEQSLWLVNYDGIRFEVLPRAKEAGRVDLNKVKVNLESVVHVVPLNDEMEEDENLVIARTRKLELVSKDSFHSRLLLCASRGVGGVVNSSSGNQSHLLTLFDLEEDEEDDEDDDEDEDGDDDKEDEQSDEEEEDEMLLN